MDDLLQEGITAYRAGKHEEAREIFITVVKQDPDNFRAWGWMYDVSKNEKERIHCLRQMARINPNNKKVEQLLRKLSAPGTRSKRIAFTPAIIGVVLVCIVAVCTGSLFFIDKSNFILTSRAGATPIIEAQLPIETIIGLTYSAAQLQTVAAYSPTPLFAPILETPTLFQPTQTLVVFSTQTQAPIIYTPLPAYETNTPFNYIQATVTQPPLIVVPTSSGGGGCCKHCSAGKPCGDSCIALDKVCTKPPGCAC